MNVGGAFVILLGVLIILTLLLIVVSFGWSVYWVVRDCMRARSNGQRLPILWYVMILLSMGVALCSWINMGWIRVVLLWTSIPMIHTAVFLLINILAAGRVSCFKSLKPTVIVSCATYLLSYLLLPDMGDADFSYMFFTLIRNDTVNAVMLWVAPILCIVSFAVLIVELVQLIILTRKKHKSSESLAEHEEKAD